jgi:hypothetical protein
VYLTLEMFPLIPLLRREATARLASNPVITVGFH